MNDAHPFLQVVWILCAGLATVATFIQMYQCQKYVMQMICIFLAGLICSSAFLLFSDPDKLVEFYRTAKDAAKMETILSAAVPVEAKSGWIEMAMRAFNYK